MKRQKRKTAPRKQTGVTPGAPAPAPHKKTRSRREFLETMGYYAAGAGLVGGVGWYFVSNVQAGIAEGDLSRLGNGIPTVVQIHDPECPRCRALQRETREAISAFEDGTIQYLVANIRLNEGRKLAAEHGVRHVTLLLFDGSGRRRSILVGEKSSEVLESEFRHLIRTSNPR